MRLSESEAVFERVKDLLDATGAQVSFGSVNRTAPVKLRVWLRHEVPCFRLGAEGATRVHKERGNPFRALAFLRRELFLTALKRCFWNDAPFH